MFNKKQILTVCLSVAVSVCLVALAVSAATTVGNNVDIGGTTISNGNLSVGGQATTTAATGNFETQGTVYSIGNLMVGGQATTTAATGNFETQGTVYSIGDLMVGGYATVTAATGNIETQGTVISKGDLSVGGHATTTALTGNFATEGEIVIGASGNPISGHLSATSSIDFGNISGNNCATSSPITIAGAAAGDTVVLGVPEEVGSVTSTSWGVFINADSKAVVRLCNPSISDLTDAQLPAAVFRVDVWKH